MQGANGMKSKRSKACDISQKVKEVVWERDNQRCIFCGSPQAMPNAHYIPRSKGGLGIEENVVTLCIRCHHAYDNTVQRDNMGCFIEGYLKGKYPEWSKEKLIYNRWGDL